MSDVDIVVVGAGGCGLVAALRAAEQGLSVAILEKGSHLGCNTEISGGMLYAAGTRYQDAEGVADTPQSMAEDILRKSGYTAESARVHAVCEVSSKVLHWLADHVGYDLELATEVRRAGQSAPRAHTDPSRSGGAALVRHLRNASARDGNVDLLDPYPVHELLTDSLGNVRGVNAGPGEQWERISSRAVILACGGFAADSSLVARYCSDATGLTYVGAETNSGESVKWGLSLGAATSHLGAFQGHGYFIEKFGTRLNPSVAYEGGIVLDSHGNRFAREDVGYSEMAVYMQRRAGGTAVVLFDEEILELTRSSDAMRQSIEAGAIRQHATLIGVADAWDLPRQTVETTVERYNASGDNATPDELGRSHSTIRPLHPPFFSAKVFAGLAHTQGGLTTDAFGRVLRSAGDPISGLYAGGGAAAGLSGDSYDGYSSGNGLLSAIGFGFLAADHASSYVRSRP